MPLYLYHIQLRDKHDRHYETITRSSNLEPQDYGLVASDHMMRGVFGCKCESVRVYQVGEVIQPAKLPYFLRRQAS